MPDSRVDDLSEPGERPHLLSDKERQRLLSATRLKLMLTVSVVLGLVLLFALVFMLVTRIFDSLTPAIARDLQWKAKRGAAELASSGELGMVTGDTNAVRRAARDYLADDEVVALVVLGREGAPLLSQGEQIEDLSALMARPPGEAHDLGARYGAWAAATIEDVEVGRVALLVSKARLDAGFELRREILSMGAITLLVALALALLFVHFHIGPILRVTTEAFERLERTTEAALAATRLKSQFLANMSHEIRTPMNGIVGVLDLMRRTGLSAKQQRYVQTMETSARGLLTIIDDILDFSRLEAGKYVIRNAELEPRQLVQEVAELLAPKAHQKGVEVVVRVDPEVPPWVIGDIDRLKQVLTNLMGNAIKFTERGHVQLRVEVEDRMPEGEIVLRFAVQDTGIGIAEADQAKLFGIFSQVDGSLTRKQGGTGLGLAICKRLVEAMGGEVGLHSVPDGGTTFWFRLPTRAGVRTEPLVTPSRNARVLLVVSDEAQRAMLGELMTCWGMYCVATDSAEQAALMILDSDPEPYDAAVVDGTYDERDPAGAQLLDVCTVEALPLIRLLSSTQAQSTSTEGSERLCLSKPVRASELYNGLTSLLDGTPLVKPPRGDSAPANSNGATPSNMGRVLVVDDNEINRLVAIDLLREFGYAWDTAENGLEAVEKVRAGEFAAILMDCQMPEMDGYEATARIRALPQPACDVAIIALTAHAMAGDRERALQAGMNDYTAKPVRARALERVLLRWTANASQTPAGAPDTARMPEDEADEGDTFTPDLDPSIPRSPRVVAVFLDVTPDLLRSLADAVQAQDSARVRALAHKLKGSCLSLGVSKMAEAAQAVERAAAEGQIDERSHAMIAHHFDVAAALLQAPHSAEQERAL